MNQPTSFEKITKVTAISVVIGVTSRRLYGNYDYPAPSWLYDLDLEELTHLLEELKDTRKQAIKSKNWFTYQSIILTYRLVALARKEARLHQKKIKPISNYLDEPDYLEFEYEGYKCEIRRHHLSLHLNGYVYLPKSSKYYGKDYGELPFDVHGGLTYSENSICDNFWVIGFDCAHYGDLLPNSRLTGTYRDIGYVTQQLKYLVDQIKNNEEPKTS